MLLLISVAINRVSITSNSWFYNTIAIYMGVTISVIRLSFLIRAQILVIDSHQN